MKNINQIFPYLIVALVAAFVGYQIAQSLEPSAACPAPTGLTEVSDTEASATVSWTTVPAARYYTVIARDLAAPTDVAGSIVVETTTATIPDLKPNTHYYVDVFSICMQNGKFFISETPTTIEVLTGSIVIDDMVLFQGNDCPFNNCTTSVTTTNNCFNWGTGTQHYSIEIIHNTTNTVVAKTYLEKLAGTGSSIHVNNYNGATPCTGAATLNPPTKLGCTANSFCGSFTQPGTTTTVNYKLTASLTQCCLDLPTSEYTLRVSSCLADGVPD